MNLNSSKQREERGLITHGSFSTTITKQSKISLQNILKMSRFLQFRTTFQATLLGVGNEQNYNLFI